MHAACFHGRLDCVLALARRGGKLGDLEAAAASNKLEPLHWACLGGHLEVAVWLRAQGARLSSADASASQVLALLCESGQNYTAAWYAAQHMNQPVVLPSPSERERLERGA